MRTKTTPAKVLATATTLVLMWTLGGCATPESAGGATPAAEVETATETTAETPSEPDPEAEPTDEPAEGPTDEPAADVEPAAPDGVGDIPLPENHMVVDEQTGDADGLDTMLVHTPGEYPGHADFYRTELPAAGWEIVSEEPAPSGFGTVFEVTSGTSRAWVHLETFDAGTALFISVGAIDAEQPEVSAESAASVELPDGFPDDVFLPVYSPSTMMAGGDHGGDMWVLEYVATATDIPTVTTVIEQEITAKGWTTTDVVPEGEGSTYHVERSGYELILAIIPERSSDADTSLHYTLRAQGE